MRFYPLFADMRDRRVVFSGAGDVAVSKLRLLLKTEAAIVVYGVDPAGEVRDWAAGGRIGLLERPLAEGDAADAFLVYCANGDLDEDRRAADIARRAGALVNIVDNLAESAFLTPAIVDRDPVTVAIGTEGAAPVLARSLKAEIEERLSPGLGTLARIAGTLRHKVEHLGARARRDLWSRFFAVEGPRALDAGGAAALPGSLDTLVREAETGERTGHVALVGAGPGDPELLTLKARRLLHEADVVLHDSLVTPEILELARREATILCVGKTGYGPAWRQQDIDAEMIAHARRGLDVVRLKSGDPGIFGRLDEETAALDVAGVSWQVVPGITAAAAAAASIGASLTRRGRNAGLRLVTGHDADGFAEQDWAALAAPGAVAAIYMGVRAASFIRGRLLMHGADPSTPVTVVENASRPDQNTVATTLIALPEAATKVRGPAVLMLGLSPRGEAAASGSLLAGVS
ncbi:MAG: siroheme synthase CysG [Flavobacteriaceae bacterium]